MGISGEWRPRYRVICPLVIAKDQTGKLHHAYRGSLLAWLNAEQREHFLRLGLIEELDSDDAPTMPSSDQVGNCVSALANLGVELKAGRPAAAKALRDAGHQFGNQIIAEAVKIRQSHAPLSDDDFEVV
ncbi:hypothetical protein [Mycobacterium intracellulare]|uniref:hypothetical protein n=1 Tax=Mycobacterium intracellulare TaxID=1767 RepID=UPI00109E3E71|nr:hypothetical protein [Mycobacterium intracellulare]